MIKSKKILLTTLPTEGEFVNWTTSKKFLPTTLKYMPLGILSLASNLPKEHEVVILDPSSRGWTIDETIEKIEREKPDVLGISALTRKVYSLNKILKETSTPYKVVGGPHATYYAKQIMEQDADAVFVGALADKEFAESIDATPKGIINCKTKISEIDYPKRDLLDIDFYFPDPKKAVLFQADNRLPMFSSIGCPNKCYFCNVQSKKLQFKNPEEVVNEMEYLYSLGSRSVHILDDNFNVRRIHLLGILEEMEKRGLNFEWSGRGQTKMDLSLLERLKQTGLKRMHVGIEAFEDEILRFHNKNETVEDVYRFCEAMNKVEIDVLGYFIIGSPIETEKYYPKLENKIRELEIKYPFFNVLFPEPDTRYYQSLLKEGFYKKDHWKEYIENPIPDFEIPYPYGEEKKKDILNIREELCRSFENEK